jgi:hypothetical protein
MIIDVDSAANAAMTSARAQKASEVGTMIEVPRDTSARSLHWLFSIVAVALAVLATGCGSVDNGGLSDEDDPEPYVLITDDGTYRYIESNGIPNHETGEFPNPGNPNSIEAQDQSFRMWLLPNESPSYAEQRLFGIGVNGVLFDPGTAEFWNNDPGSGWNYEALTGAIDLGTDSNNAHVQPGGIYHYHGMPEGLLEIESGGQARMTLIGYAADGFPVYGRFGYLDPLDEGSGVVVIQGSYEVRAGTRPDGPGGTYDGTFTQDWAHVPGSGDLDECNGRYGVTPEYPTGTYHYYVTDNFPFIPRCLGGFSDTSFDRAGGPPPPP